MGIALAMNLLAVSKLSEMRNFVVSSPKDFIRHISDIVRNQTLMLDEADPRLVTILAFAQDVRVGHGPVAE